MRQAPHNFGGLERRFSAFAESKVAVLPIPFDGTSTWGKGADRGPGALIEASRNMELYDIETDSEPYRIGIHTEKPVLAKTGADMARLGHAAAKRLLGQGKFVVTIGGEHSVSYGPMRAHFEKYRTGSILHLDAHADMREEYGGSRYNHACIMARASEFAEKIVSVGVRSMDKEEARHIDKKRHAMFLAEDIHDSDAWMEEAVGRLGGSVYVTIDLDVFDPGVLPATGTPEPGGLGWYPVLRLLRKAAERKEIIGCDVVELCPEKRGNASHPSAFLAAKLVYKLLAYVFCLKK